MSILDKLLNKRGLKDPSELSEDERQDYVRWKKILSEGEVTVESIKQFCEAQRALIETQMSSFDNDENKQARLALVYTVYGKILRAIDAPQREKEALEQYLNTLIQ